MEYKPALGMKVVTGHQSGQGISEFINRILHSMPKGQACPMWELAKEVRTKYPHINKMQSYVRINQVLTKRAGNKGLFTKLTDDSDYVLIGWAVDHPGVKKVGIVVEEDEERHDANVIDNTVELWDDQLVFELK